MNASPQPRTPGKAGRNRSVVAAIGVAASLGMLGLSFASASLYRLFCATTGFAGTTQVAKSAPARQGGRDFIVRFDANVAPGLPWLFEPETPQIALRDGKTATVFFKVANLADHALSARATYNVGPNIAGAYFDKINCFCFNEQRLDAHETAELPVVFFLDPALEQDEDMKGVAIVTLSYTFFAAKTAPSAAAAKSDASGKSL